MSVLLPIYMVAGSYRFPALRAGGSRVDPWLLGPTIVDMTDVTIKAAAWLVQFIAPPRDKDDVRHMADNPRRRHAFGLLRHHLLVVAGARDVHESFGNYEMFIAGLFDVAELFELLSSDGQVLTAEELGKLVQYAKA